MNHDILDEPMDDELADNKFYFPWFQGGDAFLYLVMILIYRAKAVTIDGDTLLVIFQSVLLFIGMFGLLKMRLEHQRQLVTVWGMVMNVVIGFFLMAIPIALIFKKFAWPYASEMQIAGFTFAPLLLIVYPLLLKDISIKIKTLLSLCFVFITIASFGMIFRAEGWAHASDLISLGKLSLFCPLIFVFLYKQNMTRKENYYVNWFAIFSIFMLYILYTNL